MNSSFFTSSFFIVITFFASVGSGIVYAIWLSSVWKIQEWSTLEVAIPIIPILESWQGRFTIADSAISKFVTRKISLSDRDYAPTDLVEVWNSGSVNEAGRKSYLRKEARDALWNMADAFANEFDTPLTVISGYRSASYQKKLWDLWKCTDTLCAPPGYSEHQLGLAIDVFEASSESDYSRNTRYKKYISWLQTHAHKYGYTQSYQKWEAIDAYEIEPWHWRYLGIELSTKLRDLGMSYTEYTRFEWVLRF